MTSMKPAYLCVLLVLAVIASAGAAIAQSAPSGGIAIVNWEYVYQNAKATKDVQSQLKEYKDKFQSSIQKEEDALRKANQELARQRSILAPEAFAAERAKFEKSLVEIQRKVQDLNGQLNEAQTNAITQFTQALNQIIARMAKERGYFLVLNSAHILVFANNLDITEEALKQLDKDLPTIKIVLTPLTKTEP